MDNPNIKVLELALDHLAYGWSAEAIHEQFPHLSLAQIHAALACFYDHQAEIERQIRRQEAEVAGWQSELGESPLQRRRHRTSSPQSEDAHVREHPSPHEQPAALGVRAPRPQ